MKVWAAFWCGWFLALIFETWHTDSTLMFVVKTVCIVAAYFAVELVVRIPDKIIESEARKHHTETEIDPWTAANCVQVKVKEKKPVRSRKSK